MDEREKALAGLIEHWGLLDESGVVHDYQIRERPARIAASEGGWILMHRYVTEWSPLGTPEVSGG